MSAIVSVLVLALAMVSAATYAQAPSFPMRLDITINGMPGSTCHLQIINASGTAADISSAGSSVNNVNVFGSDGSTIHYKIDGRDCGVTTTLYPAEYAHVTLSYQQAPSPSASPSNSPSGGSSGSNGYSNGGRA